jgi:hypothetical protein
MDRTLLHSVLKNALEAAKLPGTELSYETSMSVDTESVCAQLAVQFVHSATQPSLCLTHLMEQLQRQTTVASMDLVGAPRNQVILQGSADEISYKVVLQL